MLQYLFYWINVIYIDLHLNNQGFQGLYGLKLLVFFSFRRFISIMQITFCRLIFDQIKYKNLLLRNCYGRPPDRLPMFQLELKKQFDKLEK
jgi:hypothetical protein